MLGDIFLIPTVKAPTFDSDYNFDRGHQNFYKIVGALWFKKDILSQKLLCLKYYSKCKKLKMVVLFTLFTFPYVGFSLSKLAFKNAF